MNRSAAVDVRGVCHRYGDRLALNEVDLDVRPGEIFALLGPNGGGKTTLFRLLSTLVALQQGEIEILGLDLRADQAEVRERIGVVFQAPSLDKKLTVRENLHCQGHLYGLSGRQLRKRSDTMLEQLGIEDRSGDLAEELSGGLRRRVELAKGMIHGPQLLLLDEPTTGVDPSARIALWDYLERIRSEQEVTVVLTTHLLEEGGKADRIAILNEGRVVALDAPRALEAAIGGNCITIETSDPGRLAIEVREQFGLEPAVVEGTLRLERDDAPDWVAKLAASFPDRIDSITVGRPTLEDVFIARTGRRYAGGLEASVS